MFKYQCLKCNWQGDNPDVDYINEEEYLEYCPKGCISDNSKREVVVLNPDHPENMRKFARALNTR